MATALIFGSTGAVGSQILATLISSTAYTSITTISRREPSTQNTRVSSIIEADTQNWGTLTATLSPPPSVVFNAVGTTFASAGSVAAQWAVDHDLCVENAKAAKAAGVKDVCVLLKCRHKWRTEPLRPDAVCENEKRHRDGGQGAGFRKRDNPTTWNDSRKGNSEEQVA